AGGVAGGGRAALLRIPRRAARDLRPAARGLGRVRVRRSARAVRRRLRRDEGGRLLVRLRREMRSPRILETTLRDGSYAIDFQFTARDTELICRELERAGFDLIEVGHGIGLGADEAGKGDAAESDESYMRAAASALERARWGMFCIPGIATLRHLDLAAA